MAEPANSASLCPSVGKTATRLYLWAPFRVKLGRITRENRVLCPLKHGLGGAVFRAARGLRDAEGVQLSDVASREPSMFASSYLALNETEVRDFCVNERVDKFPRGPTVESPCTWARRARLTFRAIYRKRTPGRGSCKMFGFGLGRGPTMGQMDYLI
ncbi:hypothetical protein H6P81_002127 [Aristolochia fimbriata]|uniref:Uncharacterized protein n=1 Tax=Aristolochia fimbriata TaxID=158543 RepID=A0AAV7F9I4_ARIFI|nr:hypothetical protein H6P81_002127 [Aristolochia fimbriata]